MSLPTSADLRPNCSPIVSQGALGSCTANEICSGLREYLMIKNGEPFVRLSRMFLYWFERDIEGTTDTDSGASIYDGLNVLKHIGVCPEAEEVYDISQFRNPPTDQDVIDAKKYRIRDFWYVRDLDEMKTAIGRDELPVVAGIWMYSSFYRTLQDGIVPEIQPDERPWGGHCVLIVGYDDVKQHIIIRNSWGDKWGDNGYCYMSYQTAQKYIQQMWTGVDRMNEQEFIQMVATGAQQFQRSTGVFASVTIAQCVLETGWGRFIPTDDHTGQESYNLFGIKGVGPAGSVRCETWEVVNGHRQVIVDQFRAYHNYGESIADHGAFLSADAYAPVRHAKTPEDAAQALYDCHYCTDPDYPKKLSWIINAYNLHQYDIQEDEMTDQERQLLNDTHATLMALVDEVHRDESEDVPDWAKPTIDKLVAKGVLHQPSGNDTFYRILVIFDRLGKFD